MIKKNCWIYAIWIGLILCAQAWAAAPRPLDIVATTPELGALAAALSGEAGRVRTITSGKEDPHFLNARPTFVVMARDADLWIRMGMDLEVGWEPVLLESARNPAIRVGQSGHFDAGEAIAYALEVPDATATRAQGDVHPHGNPHYMLDPLNARAVAIALADRLGRIDPVRQGLYEANLSLFLQRLDEAMFGEALVDRLGAEQLWAAEVEGVLPDLLAHQGVADLLGGWRHAMWPWREKPIITFHKSWSYFVNRFGLAVAAHLEPLPGVPPSPAHLARVIETAGKHGAALIVREPFYPPRPADFVSRETGIPVVVVSCYGADASAGGYFALMDIIVGAFTRSIDF
ncbi:MAG: zinc ABC transporter substrate-binding protein [Desulfatitalea sp.]|nr:zinc ABC transporter substrate-binding protein [Desulfatitalea sp.]